MNISSYQPELAKTADWMVYLGRIGPPPPGFLVERWARLSNHEKKAMIAQQVAFADSNRDKVHRQCRQCGAAHVEIVDVEELPPPPAD